VDHGSPLPCSHLLAVFPTHHPYAARNHDSLRAERWATMYFHCRFLFLPVALQLQHSMTSDFLRSGHCSLPSIATRQSFRDWLDDANATLFQSPHVLGCDFLSVNSMSLESPKWRSCSIDTHHWRSSHLVPHVGVHRRRNEPATMRA
jgi:hypothetical protein